MGPRKVRVYTPWIGSPRLALALELEYESLADYERSRAEVRGSPEGAAFFEKWDQVTEPGAGYVVEIWTLED